jgi:acetate kinase
MTDPVLVLNCGSSSIKFALFETSDTGVRREPFWKGQVDDVMGAASRIRETGLDPADLVLARDHPFLDALRHIRARVLARLAGRPLGAVAHRVVHGGAKYLAPVRVDRVVLADLRSYIPLAPLHQPFALEAIEALLDASPDLPQIACFDTSFHQHMPEVERMLALPYAAWERGLRRYGFHGLSYEYMAVALPERHGEAARGRVIVAHLGSGASLCALHRLESVATTMGFSALDGLMMGTRCGSIDPGVLLYLLEVDGVSPKALGEMLYRDSGLLGVSGVSPDPRELLAQEGDAPRVRAALALYVRRIVREIGALTAVLGGLDMLVFTAGIGEHNAEVRARICAGLGFLDIQVDAQANAGHAPTISRPGGRVTVAVEPTNEEWVAARDALALVSAPAAKT